jgi:DNA modification methylase
MLFDWQRDIVAWALRRGRGCLFEDCGLGKTAQQLEWAQHIPGRVLILAPLAVSTQTVAEGQKFGIDCAQSRDGKPKGKITITNYEMLHHFSPKDYAGVVLDESSILKAHTGKYRTEIIGAFADTEFKLACTATPAPNDIMELANHVEFMGLMKRPEFLATWFVHDGGDTSKWRLKRHAEQDFWRWMATWSVMIQTPSDIGYSNEGFDLPPLRFHEHHIETGTPLNDDELFAQPAMSLNEQRAARRLTQDARVARVAELVASKPDEQWLVWCELNAESESLTAAIPNATEVAGRHSNDYKERSLLGFANGELPVLVSKPKLAGHGLNLQTCHNQAFVGVSHSFEQTYQAVRRSWRFGQESPVDVHFVTTDLDSAVLDNVRRKERDHKTMAREMVAVMAETTMEQLTGVERQTDEHSRDYSRGKNWELYHGDCVDEMVVIDDDTVGLTVHSPPFASLYTYSNSDRDMGNCRDYEEFMEHYKFLVDDLLRVTMPGRLCCVHCMDLPVSKERDGHIGLRDFPGIITRCFEDAGWWYHSKVTIWKDPVTAMQRTKAIGLLWKQIKKDSHLSRQGIADFVVTFRKPGDNPRPISHTAAGFPVEQWQKWASPVWMDINPSDTLQKESARDEKDERHIAPLQLEVIRRLVRLWSNPGDLVLSPFAGIGSEGVVALQEGRKFVGIELKESYYKQARANLQTAMAQGELFDHA